MVATQLLRFHGELPSLSFDRWRGTATTDITPQETQNDRNTTVVTAPATPQSRFLRLTQSTPLATICPSPVYARLSKHVHGLWRWSLYRLVGFEEVAEVQEEQYDPQGMLAPTGRTLVAEQRIEELKRALNLDQHPAGHAQHVQEGVGHVEGHAQEGHAEHVPFEGHNHEGVEDLEGQGRSYHYGGLWDSEPQGLASPYTERQPLILGDLGEDEHDEGRTLGAPFEHRLGGDSESPHTPYTPTPQSRDTRPIPSTQTPHTPTPQSRDPITPREMTTPSRAIPTPRDSSYRSPYVNQSSSNHRGSPSSPVSHLGFSPVNTNHLNQQESPILRVPSPTEISLGGYTPDMFSPKRSGSLKKTQVVTETPKQVAPSLESSTTPDLSHRSPYVSTPKTQPTPSPSKAYVRSTGTPAQAPSTPPTEKMTQDDLRATPKPVSAAATPRTPGKSLPSPPSSPLGVVGAIGVTEEEEEEEGTPEVSTPGGPLPLPMSPGREALSPGIPMTPGGTDVTSMSPRTPLSPAAVGPQTTRSQSPNELLTHVARFKTGSIRSLEAVTALEQREQQQESELARVFKRIRGRRAVIP